MRIGFQSEIEGRDWWKIYSIWWFLSKFPEIMYWMYWHGRNYAGYSGVVAFLEVASLLITPILVIHFCRVIFPKIRLGDYSFGFSGESREFLKIIVSGILLSIITLGIYAPWFIRKAMDYLAGKTSLNGGNFHFSGNPLKLLKILPLILAAVVVFFTFFRGHIDDLFMNSEYSFIFTLPVIIVLVSFYYHMWLVDFSWQETTIRLEAKFWPSFAYVLVQFFLIAITVGIYAPIAFLKTWDYFSRRIILRREGELLGCLGFEASFGEGFKLILVQGILTIITLGLYFPWGFAKIANWVARYTSLEVVEHPRKPD